MSFAWIAFVEPTPASKRPYVGSSTNNTELGLTFEYNGLGRVEGQAGGPNSVVVAPGAYVPAARQRAVDAAARAHPAPPPRASAPMRLEPRRNARSPRPSRPGREKDPIPFGEAPKPLRLFGKGLGDQAGWLLPFALFGLLGLAVLVLVERSPRRSRRPTPRRALGRRHQRQTHDTQARRPLLGRLPDRGTRAWRPCSCSAAGSSSRRPC